jgi:hypothetical protein
MAVEFQKLPVEGGEEPGFCFRGIAQPVALPRPNEECLLGQIARVVLVSRQAVAEPVKWFVIAVDQQIKFRMRHVLLLFPSG